MTSDLPRTDVADRRRRGQALLDGLESRERGHVTVLSSFNVEWLPPLLAEALDRARLPLLEVRLGEFGQINLEALNPRSVALEHRPDAVVVIPAVEDMLAALYDRSAPVPEQQLDSLIEARVRELSTALDALLARLPSSMIYVVAFGTDRAPNEHLLDPTAARRGQRAIEHFLWRVRNLGALSPRIAIIDWDWHTRAEGTRRHFDERLWYLARMRLNPLGLATLSDLLALHIGAHGGATHRVIAIDLDNTLWGGVIGEDGMQGIVCGDDGVGLAFQDFQRELLALRETGVILAACSKNNPADAHEVLDRHPGMVLRREHFATERINWEDKATNIVAIADELDLGLDRFVMLDDNLVEREYIRRALPAVAVPELPQDPVRRPAFLRNSPLFRRLSLTQTDSERPAAYTAHVARKRARTVNLSLEDYIRSLEQTLSIEAVDDASLARAAQLCQRTNQFNLTSKRYTIAELEHLLSDADTELHTVAVRDRFGDSGITGLTILRFTDRERVEIDTFLLSCRVLGRAVEDAVLEFAARRARARGARFLGGSYVATAKNAQVADFYSRAGFEAVGEGVFRLDLERSELGRDRCANRVGAHA
jgi:FkbH-like protein